MSFYLWIILEPSPYDCRHGTGSGFAPVVGRVVHVRATDVQVSHVLVALFRGKGMFA